MLNKMKKVVSGFICMALMCTLCAMPSSAKTEGSSTAYIVSDCDGNDNGTILYNDGTSNVYNNATRISNFDEEHGAVAKLTGDASSAKAIHKQKLESEAKALVLNADLYFDDADNTRLGVFVRRDSNSNNHSCVVFDEKGMVAVNNDGGNIAASDYETVIKPLELTSYSEKKWHRLTIYYSNAPIAEGPNAGKKPIYYYLDGKYLRNTFYDASSDKVCGLVFQMQAGFTGTVYVDNIDFSYADEGNDFYAKANYGDGNVNVTFNEPISAGWDFDNASDEMTALTGTKLVDIEKGEEIACTLKSQSANRLELTTSAELKGDTEYLIKLPSGLRSVSGKTLAFDNVYFTTSKAYMNTVVDDNCDTSDFYARNATFTSAVAENGAVKITNNKSNTSECAVWYHDNAEHSGNVTGYSTDIETADYLECSVDFKVPVKTYYGRLAFQFRSDTALNNAYRIVAAIRSDGTVYAGSDYPSNTASGTKIGDYKVNEWNNLRIVFNKKASTISMYLNGVETVLTGRAYPTGNSGITFRVVSSTIDANTATEMYLDNVYIGTSKSRVSKVRVNGADESFGMCSDGEIPATATTAEVYFNHALTTPSASNFLLKADGSETNLITNVAYDAASNKATLTFAGLESNKKYTLATTGITNSSGGTVDNYSASFTTKKATISGVKLTDAEGTEIVKESIVKDSVVYAYVETDGTTPVTVLIAQYNDGYMTKAEVCKVTASYADALIEDAFLTVSDNSNLTLKAFVWSDTTELKPLCDAKEY